MGDIHPRDIKERTFQSALEILLLCRSLETGSGTEGTLSRQLLRSGTSIGANVQEAQAGQSRADFVSKYAIALKEARETIYWLSLLCASRQSQNGQFNMLLDEANEIARILGAIIVNTKKIGKDK